MGRSSVAVCGRDEVPTVVRSSMAAKHIKQSRTADGISGVRRLQW
ncbi:MAG: hypothetical protein ACYTEL_20790 [Planctomycetota bacterium]